MRAIIAHPPREDILPVRRILLGAGWECSKHDCVEWSDLEARLAGGGADLVVLDISELPSEQVEALCDAVQLTSAASLLIGNAGSQVAASLVRRLEATDFIDKGHLAEGLERALDQAQAIGLTAAQRGSVYTVWAALPGTGVTTISANLADALAHASDPGVGILELTTGVGRLAQQLDVELPHSAEQACERWTSLDLVGFRASLASHKSGLHVFANSATSTGNPFLNRQAVRRLLSLTRTAHSSTVVALGSAWDETAAEVLRLSDRTLLLTRPDVPSIRRLAQMFSLAIEAGVDEDHLDVVVNRWGMPGGLSRDQIVSTLGLTPVEFIPDDPAAANQAANDGVLLRAVGRSKIVRRLDALATALRSRHALAV